MRSWICALVLCYGNWAAAAVTYPTFQAIAKHPVGGGKFMLVIPGYVGFPVYVDAADQVVEPPAETSAQPTNWLRLSDGRVVYAPQTLPSPFRINPQPAFIVVPMPLRTGRDGPPRYGP